MSQTPNPGLTSLQFSNSCTGCLSNIGSSTNYAWQCISSTPNSVLTTSETLYAWHQTVWQENGLPTACRTLRPTANQRSILFFGERAFSYAGPQLGTDYHTTFSRILTLNTASLKKLACSKLFFIYETLFRYRSSKHIKMVQQNKNNARLD
jgi:hypothetical protein